MRQLLLWGLVLGISGWTVAAVAEEKVPPNRKPEQLLSDASLKQSFRKKLLAMKEADKTSDPAKLIEQLSRNHCPNPGFPEAGVRPQSAAEIYRNHKQSVVIVGYLHLCGKCDKLHVGCASGFVIHKDGIIATSYHVMAGERRQAFGVMTADGSIYNVEEVLAADKARDVAILRINAEGLNAVAFEANEAVGNDVTVISHPANRFYALTRGVVSRYSARHRYGESVRLMEITADYAKGSSGGPVFNERGNVVGMVYATDSIYYTKQDGAGQKLQMVVKTCIPADVILSLFDRPPGK